MDMRRAVLVAGLTLGAMSGGAQASVTYNVNVSDLFDSAVGTITTDDATGVLSQSDITSFSLTLTRVGFFGPSQTVSIAGSGSGVFLTPGRSDLTVSGNELLFSFSGDGSTLSFSNTDPVKGVSALTFYSGESGTSSSPYTAYTIDGARNGYSVISDRVVIGESLSGPSPVPLPASAPMFGAALAALGAVGYGLKRRGVAAA